MQWFSCNLNAFYYVFNTNSDAVGKVVSAQSARAISNLTLSFILGKMRLESVPMSNTFLIRISACR